MKSLLIPLLLLGMTTISHSEELNRERLTISPGLANPERLTVRDPQGRVEFYVERTITGNLVIRDKKGSTVGRIDEDGYRRHSTGQSRRRGSASKRLSLPFDW
jgi:hypothetical protein